MSHCNSATLWSKLVLFIYRFPDVRGATKLSNALSPPIIYQLSFHHHSWLIHFIIYHIHHIFIIWNWPLNCESNNGENWNICQSFCHNSLHITENLKTKFGIKRIPGNSHFGIVLLISPLQKSMDTEPTTNTILSTRVESNKIKSNVTWNPCWKEYCRSGLIEYF